MFVICKFGLVIGILLRLLGVCVAYDFGWCCMVFGLAIVFGLNVLVIALGWFWFGCLLVDCAVGFRWFYCCC